MLTLVDGACADLPGPRTDDDEINATARDDIARWIVALTDWRLANDRRRAGRRRTRAGAAG
ncbi:hypothetical protein [Pseudorhodoplanes sp.]|uniref:hypothetical protein n=1 Tax=Pseudorhodoplanes sp. TaxID=1934341 RepID=UPI003D1352EC